MGDMPVTSNLTWLIRECPGRSMAWENLSSGETHFDGHGVMCRDEMLGEGASSAPAPTSQKSFDITPAGNIEKQQKN